MNRQGIENSHWSESKTEHGKIKLSTLAIITTLAISAGYVFYKSQAITYDEGQSDSPDSKISKSPATKGASKQEAIERACIEKLPLRVKLGQKLMVGIGVDHEDPAADNEVFNKYHVGGAILMTEPADSSDIATFKKGQTFPIEVAVDQEGGKVQRIKSHGRMPSAETVAETMSPSEAAAMAEDGYRYLKSIGIDTTFAPVTDVSSRTGENPLPTRTFGSDPNVVAQYAGAYVDGARKAGVRPVLKHFPGMGKATANTDFDPAVTPTWKSLMKSDLLPYRKLTKKNVDVMVGNPVVPGLSDGLPASLSREIVTNKLRNDFGYKDEVIYTDALEARAIALRYSLAEAAVRSWRAGVDVALFVTPEKGKTLGAQIDEIIDQGVDAVKAGTLKTSEINASVDRLYGSRHIDPCALPTK